MLVLILIVVVIFLAFSYFWLATFAVAGALARRDESDQTKAMKVCALLLIAFGGEAIFWSQFGSVIGHDMADSIVNKNANRTSGHYRTVETLSEIGGFLLLGLPLLTVLGCCCACLRCESQNEAIPLLSNAAETTASAVAWNESRQRLLSELDADGVLQGFLKDPKYKHIVRAYMHLLFEQSAQTVVPQFKAEQYPVAEAMLVATAMPAVATSTDMPLAVATVQSSLSQQGQHGLYSPVMTRNDDAQLKVGVNQLNKCM